MIMTMHRHQRIALLAAILALLGTGAFFWRATTTKPAPRRASVFAGRNVLAGETGEPLASRLARMDWPDIAPTAEAAAATPELFEALQCEASVAEHVPARYLLAMLRVESGEPAAALEIFRALPTAQIPAEFQYAPFRLHEELASTEANPYRPALLEAIAARHLPPLLEARVRAHEGEFAAALEAYLGSDPAQWTRHDVRLFEAMQFNSGVANEAQRVIAAALRAGRMPATVRNEMTDLLRQAQGTRAATGLTARLAGFLAGNGAAKAAATQAVTAQLAVRKAFSQKQYASLLGQFREHAPMALTDETLLILFLSAARTADVPSTDRWAQELKRRNPSPHVAQWVSHIRSQVR